MPTYDYHCPECSNRFDALHAWNRPLTECPRCGSGLLQRRFPCPAVKTAATFEAGRGSLLDQLHGDQHHADAAMRNARLAGGNPSAGDIYMPTLARFCGDPEAFIPTGGGEQYVKKLLRKRRWDNGELSVKHDRPPRQRVALAPDLVEQQRQKLLKREPSLAVKDQGELRHEIIKRHGRKRA